MGNRVSRMDRDSQALAWDPERAQMTATSPPTTTTSAPATDKRKPLKKPHTWSEATTISSTCDSPTRKALNLPTPPAGPLSEEPDVISSSSSSEAGELDPDDPDDDLADVFATTQSQSGSGSDSDSDAPVGYGDQRIHRVRRISESSGSLRRADVRPASWWQQVLAYVLPCYNDGNGRADKPSDVDGRPVRRRKRRRAISGPDMARHHAAFWDLVQRMLALNDVVLMIAALQEYLAAEAGATQCAVFLVDPTKNEMARISNKGNATAPHLSLGRGIVGHVFSTQQSVCRQHFEQDYFFDPEIDLAQESVRHKLLCVPLIEHDVCYAIVEATTPALRHHSETAMHLQLLSWLGPILSACMRKCIQFHDVLLSERTQTALLHILSSSDTDETVLHLVDGVIAGACHITKAERVALFMVDWERGELWSLCSSAHDETVRVPIIGSALGVAATNGETLNITDARTDPRFSKRWDERDGISTRCALYIPVGIEPTRDSEQNMKPMAVLEMLNKDDGAIFTLDDEYAFEAFASEVAVILRRRSNEIEYIKLLADTRADKVLAQRAKSQVNLLECYTEYVANASKDHATDRLHHSLFWSASNDHLAEAEESLLKHPQAPAPRQVHVRYEDQVEVKHFDAGLKTAMATPRATPTLAAPSESGDSWSVHFEDVSPSSSEQSTLDVTDDGETLWDSNIFEIDPDLLPVLSRNMMLDFHIDDILDTDIETLDNFIHAVQEMYHPNPFHNFVHAVSVLQTAYIILRTTEASKMLQPLEIAATLIAALCHDVDHPGHTNAYEIVSKSQLALLYSDDSVLERHHAYTTFRIMAKEKNANILANLSTADFRYVRKMIVDAILATDMAQHFKMYESLEKMLHPSHHPMPMTSSPIMRCESWPACVPVSPVNRTSPQSSEDILSVLREAVCQGDGANSTPRCTGKPPRPQPLASANQRAFVFNGTQEERSFLVKSIIHASDLCGQVFPKACALKWSNMVSREFAYQALLEQADHLPVTYQHIDDPLQLVESQHFFAHKIVGPLWILMVKMFPELSPCLRNLNENIAHYEHEMQRLKQVQHKKEAQKLEEASPAVDPATYSDDEGMAVPGVGRCTPAKFISFRSKSRSNSRADGTLDLQGLIDQDELIARMQSLKSHPGPHSRLRRSFSIYRTSESGHHREHEREHGDHDTKEVSNDHAQAYLTMHNRRRLASS